MLICRSTVSSSQQGDSSVSEGDELYVTSVVGRVEEQRETIGFVNRNSDSDSDSDSECDACGGATSGVGGVED